MFPFFYSYQLIVLYLLELVYLPTNAKELLTAVKAIMDLQAMQEPKEIALEKAGPSFD